MFPTVSDSKPKRLLIAWVLSLSKYQSRPPLTLNRATRLLPAISASLFRSYSSLVYRLALAAKYGQKILELTFLLQIGGLPLSTLLRGFQPSVTKEL